jgi:hypothetical protein
MTAGDGGAEEPERIEGDARETLDNPDELAVGEDDQLDAGEEQKKPSTAERAIAISGGIATAGAAVTTVTIAAGPAALVAAIAAIGASAVVTETVAAYAARRRKRNGEGAESLSSRAPE